MNGTVRLGKLFFAADVATRCAATVALLPAIAPSAAPHAQIPRFEAWRLVNRTARGRPT
jgi:hypothetical protein